jgi:pilus assembly protein CpaE
MGVAANRDPGQASVELVAVLPALVVCVVIAAQAVAAGWALWSAGNAARAGARAERVGSDGEAAARRSLPAPLRDGAMVSAGDGVQVSVRVPALLPGVTMPRIAASSRLDAGTG